MSAPTLTVLDLSKPHHFIKPVKRINEGQDVAHFLTSCAYRDICLFVMQLNVSMCPRIFVENGVKHVRTWNLVEGIVVEGLAERIQSMLKVIEALIDAVPPDTGPRRFGNISFRRWHEVLEERIVEIVRGYIPHNILDAGEEGEATAQDELVSYLLGSFGSGLRLDFGTGHELSFLAFLGCLWKMGGFTGTDIPTDGSVERSIVLGVLEPYLNVIRKLVLNYTLEPAGSHGVWGLDDHFFLSYIFGSAQYSPAINDGEPMPTEGSLLGAPSPSDVTNKATVELERKANMYFEAIGFIYDVKTGPFWEHSPILFDISGIKSGWAKVNKGMIKMYNAEVLSKFPVVQHFYLGSLFSWDKDPAAADVPASVHMANQPASQAHHTISVTGDTGGAPTTRPAASQEGTRAPWASAASSSTMPMTTAPWATGAASSTMPMTAVPWARTDPRTGGAGPLDQAGTRASWAQRPPAGGSQQQEATRAPWLQGTSTGAPQQPTGMPPTRAPRATGGSGPNAPPR